MSAIDDYIRWYAPQAKYGVVDPNVAVRVAGGEGGLQNPFRRGEGPAPRTQAPGLGPTENSFGPFQLYVSGTGAGLGDRAVAAGIDPRKDWKAGVRYALDEASQKGWGQWYGAKAAGITGMMGIGGAPGPAGGAPLPVASAGPTPAGIPASGPPQAFGDMLAPPVAPAPPDLGQIAANFMHRRKAEAEAEAADQARRQALFGGGLGDLYG